MVVLVGVRCGWCGLTADRDHDVELLRHVPVCPQADQRDHARGHNVVWLLDDDPSEEQE